MSPLWSRFALLALLRQHLAQIEASPFDGCVYHVGGDMGGGQMGAFTWNAWGRKRSPASELADAVREAREGLTP